MEKIKEDLIAIDEHIKENKNNWVMSIKYLLEANIVRLNKILVGLHKTDCEDELWLDYMYGNKLMHQCDGAMTVFWTYYGITYGEVHV